MSTAYACIVRLEAKPDRAADVEELLTGAVPLAQAEERTVRSPRLNIGVPSDSDGYA